MVRGNAEFSLNQHPFPLMLFVVSILTSVWLHVIDGELWIIHDAFDTFLYLTVSVFKTNAFVYNLWMEVV